MAGNRGKGICDRYLLSSLHTDTETAEAAESTEAAEEAEEQDVENPQPEQQESNGQDNQQESTEAPVQEAKTEFEILREDFEKVLEDLEGKDMMTKFAAQYSDIYKKLLEVHDNEGRIQDLVQEHENTINENQEKLAASKELSEKDQASIETLQKELDLAHENLDSAHVREQNLQETLENLRAQIAKLTHEIELRNQLDMEDEERGATVKNKALLQRERDRLFREKSDLIEDITNLQKLYDEQLEKNKEAEVTIVEMKEDIEVKSRIIKDTSVKLEILTLDIKTVKQDLRSKEEECYCLNKKISITSQIIQKIEMRLKEELSKVEAKNLENERLKNEIRTLKGEISRMQSRVDNLKAENNEIILLNKEKIEEIGYLSQQIAKAKREIEFATKKLQNIENSKGTIGVELAHEKEKVITYKRELEMLKRKEDADKRTLEELTREREILKNQIRRITDINQKQHQELKTVELDKNILIKNMNELKEDILKTSLQIKEQQKENDRMQVLLIDANKELENVNDELKLAQTTISDGKKQISELECEIKKQQNISDALWSEKKTISKNLVRAEDEVVELKQKLKVMSHQEKQIKEESVKAEMMFLKEREEREKAEKEREDYKEKSQKLYSDLQNCRLCVENLEKDATRNQKLISSIEGDNFKYKKEVDQLQRDKDSLITQLMKKNEDIAQLHVTIKELECSLQRGETQYNQRVEDIRLLKIEVKTIRQEKDLLERCLNNTTDLRQEVFHLERDLREERIKSKALEEELINPLNVHRWRKLEGSDPEAYELIQKMQLMQKRILGLAASCEERNEQLNESRKLNEALLKKIEQLPGNDAALKIYESQIALREKERKTKALEAELAMYKTKASEHKFNLARVMEDLRYVKKLEMDKRKNERTKQVK